MSAVEIREISSSALPYRASAFARCVEMHALYYSSHHGFGYEFESRVKEGLAEFSTRCGSQKNAFWIADDGKRIAGTIAIDGEDLGAGIAHLRWFIVDGTIRGTGAGQKLLRSAVSFCDSIGFPEVHLWTFKGLDAARRLYELEGFRLAEEWLGRQWGSEVMEQKFVRRAQDLAS